MSPAKGEKLIEVKGLEKHFKHVEVLRGINIDICKGDVVAVIGPSGSGKSTFLRCLNLLEEPTGGQIVFEGVDITSKEILENALTHYTGTVLYVSHDRYFINKTATRILDLTMGTLINYIGNYDYYLEKKEALTLAYASGNETNAENVSNSGDSAASTPASDSKLSWQEQKEQQARERKRKNELKKTEEEIAKLEDRNTEIDEELTKEEVYSNSIECQKLSTERAANEARLEELYELWEELAE